MAVQNTNSNKPAFSAGMVTAVITLFWVVIFALVTMHGMGGLKEHDIVSEALTATHQSK